MTKWKVTRKNLIDRKEGYDERFLNGSSFAKIVVACKVTKMRVLGWKNNDRRFYKTEG